MEAGNDFGWLLISFVSRNISIHPRDLEAFAGRHIPSRFGMRSADAPQADYLNVWLLAELQDRPVSFYGKRWFMKDSVSLGRVRLLPHEPASSLQAPSLGLDRGADSCLN